MGLATTFPRDAAGALATEPTARRTATEQVGVAAGQMLAGVGNLAFTLVMARALSPAAFARLATFLALYVLLGLPTSSLSAAAALSPRRSRRLDLRVATAGLGAGVVVAAASPWLGPILRLPVGAVASLGVAVPAIGLVAVQRGRLYGSSRFGWLVASLVGEPGVRLTVGVGAGLVFGAVGAAGAVAAAAYAALALAFRGGRRLPLRLVGAGAGGTAGPGTGTPDARTPDARTPDARTPDARTPDAEPGGALIGGGLWTVAGFLILAVIQNQDLILANRLLPVGQAGRFAALSTLGGAVAFATITVPLVFLPRAVRGQSRALPAALGVAAAVGAVGVAVAAAAPHRIVSVVFGGRYGAISGLLVPYLAAMCLLGVSRVLVVHGTTAGRHRATIAALVGAAGVQAGLIAAGGRTAGSVALATVVSTGALTAVLGGAEVVRLVQRNRPLPRLRTAPTMAVLAGLSGAALVLRLIVPRGLWIDEATSVFQARMPFGAMLMNLRTTDVHPPLWFSILWGTVRVFGSGELAVRIPSILAGVAVIPVLYAAGKEIYDRRTGLVAAAAGTVAPFLVWYSQEARMYSLFMLLALVAVWMQVRVLHHGTPLDWVGYTVASAALVWTQYFGLFQVGAQQLVFLGAVLGRRRAGERWWPMVGRWAASTVGMAALLAPLAPFAYHQYAVNQAAGKGFGAGSAGQVGTGASSTVHGLTVYSLLANVVWLLWGYHSDSAMEAVVALWPVVMLVALFLLGRRSQYETRLVAGAALVPLVGLFGVGFLKQNMFDARYFSGTAVLAVLLLARMVTGSARRTRGVLLASVVLVGTLAFGLFDQQTNGSNPRTYSFREAVHALNVDARTGDEVLYAPTDIGTVVGYYDKGHYHLAALGNALGPLEAVRGRLFVIVSPRLMRVDQTRTAGRLISEIGHHRRLVALRHYSNVEVWEFS